jgi:5-methylcytosine-specific restriction endonuclease McrA
MATSCGRDPQRFQLSLDLLPTDRAISASAGSDGDATDRPNVRCRHCDKRVNVPDWLQGLDIRLHYCDEQCRQAWVESEPDFTVQLKQRSRNRRGANWELQARRARERDQFRCQVCGITEEQLGGRMHVHHRIPFRRFRSNVEANKLEHLISVCPSCHQKEEAEVRRQLPLFAAPQGVE